MALAVRSAVAAKASCRGFQGRRVAAPANGCKVVMRAGNWFPGSDAPAWLPEDLAANYGFDPLGLGKEAGALKRFTESEVIHCRWAMLGFAGMIGVEALGFGNWYDAALWSVNGGKATYFGIEVPGASNIGALLAVEFIAFAVSEGMRGEKGGVYHGGPFDPLGLAKDTKNLETLKLKEIKNGRLAMLACIGIISQHAATGKTVIGALEAHLADPWGTNFATNGVSVPFF